MADSFEQNGSVFALADKLPIAGLGVRMLLANTKRVVSSIFAIRGTTAGNSLVRFMLGQAESGIGDVVRGALYVVGKGVGNGLSYFDGILELSDGSQRQIDTASASWTGDAVFHFDATNAYLSIGSQTNEGDLSIMNGLGAPSDQPKPRIWLTGQVNATDKRQLGHVNVMDDGGVVRILLNGNEPALELRDAKGKATVRLDGAERSLLMRDASGMPLVQLEGTTSRVVLRDGQQTRVLLDGKSARVELKNGGGKTTVLLDGEVGDVVLDGADCAEYFVTEAPDLRPGEVVCASPSMPGAVARSVQAYDRSVVGVVSGAGGLKAGLVLGSQYIGSERPSVSVALAGRVHCLAEAIGKPIRVGDLLVTSSVPGRAKAAGGRTAPGTVIGKALSPLFEGEGQVLMLVTMT